ncbi:MAG: 2-amino-4-hydroxy-6-hydroxymethyldihydropteridine diphosphokinase [Clostridiales bacterium]|nr:2-amino-4-hydroxy-6-hydroxymethyldihydropteridine diphosphokinase [Clostridiales bacterium]
MTERGKERVWLSLGGNLGGRWENLRRALSLMREKGLEITRKSSLYESEPQGYEAQGRFYNAAAELFTQLSPMQLLRLLQGIESEMGRVRETRWGPRVIDLDILLFGERVISSPELVIPHYALRERSFVLMPLVELEPNLLIPGAGAAARLLPLCPSLGIRKVCGPEEW